MYSRAASVNFPRISGFVSGACGWANGNLRRSRHIGALSNGIALSNESRALIQRLEVCTSILPPAATVSSANAKNARHMCGLGDLRDEPPPKVTGTPV